MRKFLSGLMALALLVSLIPVAATAAGSVTYKPGALKAAIANGETVLLHYKSTW